MSGKNTKTQIAGIVLMAVGAQGGFLSLMFGMMPWSHSGLASFWEYHLPILTLIASALAALLGVALMFLKPRPKKPW